MTVYAHENLLSSCSNSCYKSWNLIDTETQLTNDQHTAWLTRNTVFARRVY